MKRICIIIWAVLAVFLFEAQGQNLPKLKKGTSSTSNSENMKTPMDSPKSENTSNGKNAGVKAGAMSDFEDYVYFIRLSNITVTAEPGSRAERIIGGRIWSYVFTEETTSFATGFVTSDGYFVTARHVIEPWAYLTDDVSIDDPLLVAAVLCYEGMGGTIEATYHIESKTGDRRELYFREFSVSRHRDEEVVYTSTDSDPYNIRRAMAENDYAFVKLPMSSSLVVNRELSTRIPSGTRLEILGFPYGIGSDKNNIQPQYTYATTSNSGLYHGQIPVTGANVEEGNSGGPVFCKKDGQYYVIGIVSSMFGKHGGVIVPMSQVNF